MDSIHSDLEEGEILDDDDDDSPPSLTICSKQNKELPRRYVVHDKSTIHKHKKRDCKHAIRYQAKKLSKLKSPVKMKCSNKSHKPSFYEKSHKCSDNHNGSSSISKKIISKKHNSFSKQSLISEIKSSCKDTSSKQSTKSSKSDSLNVDSTKDFSASKGQSVKELESSENHKRNNELIDNSVNGSSHYNQVPIKNDSDFVNEANSKTECPIKRNVASSNPSEVENEESEDEEELRRIALATFAKRKAVIESSKRSTQSNEIFNTSMSGTTSIDDAQITCQEASNPVSDNYEVVDMDVDDDQNSVEIIETPVNSQEYECSSNLFVIDTNPSADIIGNKENAPSELQASNNDSDNDFEADILRAELIEKMMRKKYLENEQAEKSDVSVFQNTKPNQKQIPATPAKKYVKYHQLAKSAAINFLRKPLRSHKRILRKNVINKSVALLKSNNTKSAVPVPTSKPSERLIITLNDESSSSEDSDNADESSSVAENPVDSIVALISDCRQKSESTEKTKEIAGHVPKAVSCLSKSQQEEYNLLTKILAEKKKLPAAQNALSQKNGSVQSPLDKLKQLEKELATLKDALKLKKESVTSLSKDVTAKKSVYLKARLSAQHLREQFIAAEKVRKAKLMEWAKACDHLKFMRKSVSDLEKQINKVLNLCSEIGPHIQGQSYNLPLLPQNKQS